MRQSSATLSLFAEPSFSHQGPDSFFLSILAHAAIAGTIYYGITHLPRIDYRSLAERYSIRQLDLRTTDPTAEAEAGPDSDSTFYPDEQTRSSLALPTELNEAAHALLQSAKGRETLIQPEFDSRLSFAEFLLPTIMIWTPEIALGKKVVAPSPSPATAAHVQPSLEPPNQEIRLAEMSVASKSDSPNLDAIPTGTTSPVQLLRTKPVEMAPATISDSTDQPTPIALLSLSDLRMHEGTVRLPPVNVIAAVTSSAPAPLADTSTTAKGDNSGERRQAESPASSGHGFRAAAQPAPHPGNTVDDDVAAEGNRLTTEHIALPKDGKFGFVVVGNSVEEEFPEAVAIWRSRVAYSAYLHVGLTKSWILQYSVLQSAEVADAGMVARVEAPWPYDIIRPNLLSRDLNSDALMVHGVLTTAGRFESLDIAFPASYRYASFVLHALRQWQFRPARRNGQPIAVEVLLIIPEEVD